ncbi:MAG: ExeA family protein [Planctomycetaceae bacterium]
MYEAHWNITHRPFENWGDSRYYFPSEVHQAALLQLRYAIESRRAAVAVCGDSGMGKTLLVDTLIEQLNENDSPVARIVFPHLSGEQLLGYVADELTGESGPSDESPRITLRRLTQFLQSNVEQGKHAVVIVDEAQVLTQNDQLETLRLLLNLQHDRNRAESALTLVLAGHTTLLTQVERCRALDERLSAKCILNRFTSDQTADYIAHRVSVVGGDAEQLFSADALELLHLRSAGIPRRINRLADLALMVGFAEDIHRIEVAHIENVHQELVASAA